MTGRLLVVALAFTAMAAAPVRVDQVTIVAQWRGLGEPRDASYVITSDGNSYHLDGQLIDPGVVAALETALAAPLVSRETMLLRLTASDWLYAHQAHAGPSEFSGSPTCSNEARALFLRTFLDPGKARKALDDHFRGQHTDDHPSMVVTLRRTDGSVLSASSASQHALMLPWQTPKGLTWNPNISHWLNVLLPAAERRNERLDEAHVVAALNAEILRSIEDRWEELEERCRYASVVEEITRYFKVEDVYHAWPQQFSGHLTRSDLPWNLVIDAHLSVDAKFDQALATLRSRIDRYVALARPFVHAHPLTRYELYYFDGASLRSDDIQMREINRPHDPNAEIVSRQLQDCVLLYDLSDSHKDTQFIILPNGSVLEWSSR
jgi:hypothetical protein